MRETGRQHHPSPSAGSRELSIATTSRQDKLKKRKDLFWLSSPEVLVMAGEGVGSTGVVSRQFPRGSAWQNNVTPLMAGKCQGKGWIA